MSRSGLSGILYFCLMTSITSCAIQKEESLISQKWFNEIKWNLVQLVRGGPFDFWGGGGVGRFRLCNNFFPPRGIRQIFFPVKVQRKILFSQYISRQDIFFLSHIITAYSNLRLSHSYRQRRSRGFQSEEAENWIPRGAKEFSLCFILYGYVLMFPTLNRAGLLTKNV
jgi:hypothetical protein